MHLSRSASVAKDRHDEPQQLLAREVFHQHRAARGRRAGGRAGDRPALFRAAAAGRDLACCYDEWLRPHLTDAAAFVAAGASTRFP